MPRLYQYVGPSSIAKRVFPQCGGKLIDSVKQLSDALQSMQDYRSGESFIVTFVVTSEGKIRISDRHSEHVICAEGKLVLSAGELTILYENGVFIVENVNNQSTGYCPEPESWNTVATALDCIPIQHPEEFDPAINFRRCPSCSQINIVKDNWYACDVCKFPLPTQWNLES